MKNENAIVSINTAIEFKNERLNSLVAEIATAAETALKTNFNANVKIAQNLATIETEKLYETTGHKNISDFAVNVLGIKSRANIDAYRQVGKAINEGKLSADSGYSFSALRALAGVPAKELAEAIEAGDINPDMSVKDIEAVASPLKDTKKKTREEKSYHWHLVSGYEHEFVGTKSELEAEYAENDSTIIHEFTNDGVKFICFIENVNTAPEMFWRGAEKGKEVIDTETAGE